MPMPARHPDGRSQFLSLAQGEMISLDRHTLDEALKLIGSCINLVKNARHCEIFLTSLALSLSKWSELEIADEDEICKLQVLLQPYLDVVPESLEDVEELLNDTSANLQVILAASRLGGEHG